VPISYHIYYTIIVSEYCVGIEFASFTAYLIIIVRHFNNIPSNLHYLGPKHEGEFAKIETLSGTKFLSELGREEEGTQCISFKYYRTIPIDVKPCDYDFRSIFL